MRKKPIFSLDPDQLERLLSIGTDDPDPAEEEVEAGGDSPAGEGGPPDKDDPSAKTAASLVGMERPGGQIDRYKLLRVLGEGGMGMVFLAEQEGSIRRKVALKVIKPGMDSKRVIARFENERQALALLDHPSIAQVHDAGTTKTGRPYFVMEYVKGLPITEYCDHHRLSIEDRLKLFQQACLAVHHAHQKGIIHRDIKPSNILVSAENDRPIPKIIDFGVAKAMSQPLTDRTLFTEDSQLLGTPEYMSPEQADMVGEDIDIRSDIYSLGVLLYVLLAGVLPYDSKTFRQGGVAHVRQVIRETDPKTPSTRLTKLGDEAKKLAENRRTELAVLTRCLQKELEWIPLKAMRRDRAERYRSAIELADDIENYLNGAPLIAGPPTTIYRIKKFVRRNSVLSAAVLAVAATLILGLVGTTTMYLRAEGALDNEVRARAQAEEASQRADQAAAEANRAAEKEATAHADAVRASVEAQAVQDFLTAMIRSSARSIIGREATLLDTLHIASQRLEYGFQGQLIAEARIRATLASTYYELGYFRDAALEGDHSYRLYFQHFGKHPVGIANWAAVYHNFAGNYREAENLWDMSIKQRIADGDETEAWLKCNLACVLARQARYRESQRLFEEMIKEEYWDPNHPNHGRALTYAWDLAKVYKEQGRYQDAEEWFEKTLKAQRQRYGEEGDRSNNKNLVRCMNEVARLYVIQERYDEANDLFIEGIALGERTLPGKDHPYTLRHINGLGVLRTKQGKFQEAEELFNRALAGRKLKLGEDHPYTMETLNGLGLLHREQKHYEKAEELLNKALKGRQAKLGPDHPHTLETVHELGVLYAAKKDYDEAERLLLDAIRGREAKLGLEHPRTIESLKRLVGLYETLDKPEEAEKWRTRLSQRDGVEELN